MSIIRNVHWLNKTVFGCVEQKNFHGRVLSIRVFSSDGHYGLYYIYIYIYTIYIYYSVSPRMNTIASCDQFKPIRIGENLMVNYINKKYINFI